MEQKEYKYPWNLSELTDLVEKIKEYVIDKTLGPALQRLMGKMFVMIDDDEEKCKRIFRTQEDADTWFKARDEKNMTPEIQALEFLGNTIPGADQYQMTVTVVNDNDYALKGSGNNVIKFRFSTVDRINEIALGEAVEVFFTFKSDYGTKQVSKIFQYKEGDAASEFDATDYLESGENTITLMVRGRSSGLSRTVICTYTIVDLTLTSNFDIAIAKSEGVNFGIPYYVSGPGEKSIEFVIDGGTPKNENITDASATGTYAFTNNLSAGLHTLQMKAKTTLSGKSFESNLLFFSFVVNGDDLDLTTTVIKTELPSAGTAYFTDSNPGLIGEQYTNYLLEWAYFSNSKPNATIIWKASFNGVETVVGSQEVDEKEGTVDVMPDPVEFQPDKVGTYNLYAYVKGAESTAIGTYTIVVKENSAGLKEAANYTMKLNALGRSNNEPAETRSDWSDHGYHTTFTNMAFSGLSGYTGNAVRFDNGATAKIDIKPFAEENAVLNNGCVVTFDFMTRNVENEDVPLIEIGDSSRVSTAYFAIYGKKVVMRPSNGKSMTYQFADEERTHLAVAIYPQSGITDAHMMFFIFNGIQAPGMKYEDTAVFNIGSTEATTDDYGMIKIGDSQKRAAIDVYGIRVYNSVISMWQGMNNFMIDAGTNVGQMMRKNAIFVNNDVTRPNIDSIKEQFRCLEVIGNLGLLETSTTKQNFNCSVRYTDPFSPKFNFERLDSHAYVETAGQSRLEDKMAKSFHLDLNKDDSPATYQNGKLCHKNRFIFADGNIPENGVRIDLCAADSSIARNAAHFKMVNQYYKNISVDGEYVLRTPAMDYALSGQWSEDMVDTYGGTKADYPWNYNINIAPDSVPIVVVWHEKENDPIKVYGLGTMMEEKKASYANGNHSIYLKAPLSDGTLDPFDRYAGAKGNRGWDNTGTIEMEFLRGSQYTNSSDKSGWNAETREQSFEQCFPKRKDQTEAECEAMWQTFYDEFVAPLCDTYQNQALFNSKIFDIIDKASFAMYYNKVMDKKCNDSLCRNLHVLRIKCKDNKWRWYAKWWDVDVQSGLFKSGAMGVPVDTNRNTLDDNGQYIMSGKDETGSMWLWDGLEANQDFKDYCKKIAEASYQAGWKCDTDKAAQDDITESFSEALYNIDGLNKYLSAYRKGNDYMIRMQGSSVPYRHGFLEEAYNIREAQMAIGDYADKAVSFWADGAHKPAAAKMTASAKNWFGMGLTTTNYITGLEKNAGETFSMQLPIEEGLGRDPLRIYGVDKVSMIDVSDFMKYMHGTVALGRLTNAQNVYVGYPSHESMLTTGVSGDTSVSFSGLYEMPRLAKFSLMGFTGLQSIDLSKMNRLTHFYASATGLLTFAPANGTQFTTVELPSTLQVVNATKVKLGNVSFWQYNATANTLTEMETCPTSLLTLNLTAMGDDDGTHTLVHKWLTMLRNNPTLINTAQINYPTINWTSISKDDLMTLIQIPKAQRRVRGYVFCNTAYTAEEQASLLEAFGPNTFDYGSQSDTLVCDCYGDAEHGINIQASATGTTPVGNVVVTDDGISILQGSTAILTSQGFPLATGSVTYEYRVKVDGEWTSCNASRLVVNFGNNSQHSLNWKTGELVIAEANEADKSFDFNVERSDGQSCTQSILIKARTYPTAANVTLNTDASDSSISLQSGVYNITARGYYVFDANHTPAGYTGNMDALEGGTWEIVGVDSSVAARSEDSYVEGRTPFDEFTMQVKTMPEGEVPLQLKYKSKWKNELELNATTLDLMLVSVVLRVLTNSDATGNPTLFNAIAHVYTHADPTSFDSLELKAPDGTLDIAGILTEMGVSLSNLTSVKSGERNVLDYLVNVATLNLDGTGIEDELDIRKMKRLTLLNAENTNADIKF